MKSWKTVEDYLRSQPWWMEDKLRKEERSIKKTLPRLLRRRQWKNSVLSMPIQQRMKEDFKKKIKPPLYMKKILVLGFSLAILVVSCNKPVKGKNGVTYKTAVEYNDYIVNRQSTLIKDVIAFGGAAQTNLDSAEHMLTDFVKQAGTMI